MNGGKRLRRNPARTARRAKRGTPTPSQQKVQRRRRRHSFGRFGWVARGDDLFEAEKTTKDHDVTRLEQQLIEKLGAKVAINHGSKGKGKIVINYQDLAELDGILSKIH